MLDIVYQIAVEELKNIEKEFIEVVTRQGDFSEFTMVLEKRLKNRNDQQ